MYLYTVPFALKLDGIVMEFPDKVGLMLFIGLLPLEAQ